jgi:ATP-dependent exoDNAse (exonuclease V) beta subunit
MVDILLNKLDVFDDPKFKFDPIKHKYTYEGSHFISVTQFIQQFHEKFNTEYWSKKKADEGGVSQEEILKEWKRLNDRANEIGTATHNWIENYFNRIYQELPSDPDVIDRINKFNVAFGRWLHKLKPIVFERRIFSLKWKIAGMIDSIFLYNDKIIILDWKTNKDFTHNDHPKGKYEKLLSPFNEHYKNHLSEYSIQVSLYKLILREAGIDIKACYLMHIGPEGDARMYTAMDFTKILEEYLDRPQDTIEQKIDKILEE